jgi:hypothetical protein
MVSGEVEDSSQFFSGDDLSQRIQDAALSPE